MEGGKIEQLSTIMGNIGIDLDDYGVNQEAVVFSNLVSNVEAWAEEKGILDKATPLSQQGKTEEEVQEIRDALEEDNREELIDAIGDTLVTLIIQCKMNDLNIIDCLDTAYAVIKGRTGVMKDGVFVKD